MTTANPQPTPPPPIQAPWQNAPVNQPQPASAPVAPTGEIPPPQKSSSLLLMILVFIILFFGGIAAVYFTDLKTLIPINIQGMIGLAPQASPAVEIPSPAVLPSLEPSPQESLQNIQDELDKTDIADFSQDLQQIDKDISGL